MEDEIYIHEKRKERCIKGQILEAMNVIIVGRSRNWLGEMYKGKTFLLKHSYTQCWKIKSEHSLCVSCKSTCMTSRRKMNVT